VGLGRCIVTCQVYLGLSGLSRALVAIFMFLSDQFKRLSRALLRFFSFGFKSNRSSIVLSCVEASYVDHFPSRLFVLQLFTYSDVSNTVIQDNFDTGG